MLYKPHFFYRLKLVIVYLIVKLKFLHPLLPESFRDELPIGWNEHMFWVAFKSGGKKRYFNYYCQFRQPESYQPKATVETKYQLTESEIRSFYQNGYLGPFDLIPSEQVAQVRQHLIDLANTEGQIFSYARGDFEFKNRKQKNDKNNVHEPLTEAQKGYIRNFNSYDRHLEDPLMLSLFSNPAVTERCAQLLGPDLLLWHSNYFPIPPLSKGTPWHQASTWLSHDLKDSVLQPKAVEELFELTCWIALTDVPKERAPMKIVAGSQKEIYPIESKTEENKSSLIYGEYGGVIDYQIDPKDIKLFEAKAGQFFIFCERAIHGSEDNLTNDWRWAVNGRIVTPETKIYTKHMLENGLDLAIFEIEKMKLDNWKAVLIRGEDRFGYNRVIKAPSLSTK